MQIILYYTPTGPIPTGCNDTATSELVGRLPRGHIACYHHYHYYRRRRRRYARPGYIKMQLLFS